MDFVKIIPKRNNNPNTGNVKNKGIEIGNVYIKKQNGTIQNK